MMCQRIGMPPISIIGLGLRCVSSEIRVPSPPARITAFMIKFFRHGNVYMFYGYLRNVHEGLEQLVSDSNTQQRYIQLVDDESFPCHTLHIAC